jgi:hypothetical protein
MTTTGNDNVSQDSLSHQPSAHIERSASYPIPQPLSRLLRATILEGQEAQLENVQDALSQLVSNSFEAMDSMYFNT